MTKNVYIAIILTLVIASVLVSGCTDKRDYSKYQPITKDITIISVESTGDYKWNPNYVVSSEPEVYKLDGYNNGLYDIAKIARGMNVTIIYICYYDREYPFTKEIISISIHPKSNCPDLAMCCNEACNKCK